MRRTNLVLVVLSFILIAGCEQIDSQTEASPEWNGTKHPSGEPIVLDEVEIREYQGEKLGSVNDFRENSIKGPQYIDINDYQLEISGLVEEPRNYTYEQILDHQQYSKVVTLYCVEGWNVRIFWEGFLLKDLFDETKVKPEANTVILYAYDGYSTSMPLDYILDNNIMIAYMMNNVTLPPERGFPFQLVAADKAGYKWIKWITRIRLSDNPDYRGYWESRGWNQDADIK
jgi:DMSO/TMAO reductase YedYZ molybdopterin-dependent catalytic subunit